MVLCGKYTVIDCQNIVVSHMASCQLCLFVISWNYETDARKGIAVIPVLHMDCGGLLLEFCRTWPSCGSEGHETKAGGSRVGAIGHAL